MEQNTPLVSICVITYNSAKYVIETLDSAKSQTYKNIELIISDDCSTDNTVEICKQWIECNGSIFKRVELLESAINTGVSANLNRSFSACKGEWVKAIAGDDILLENCIADNINFLDYNPEAEIVFSKVQPFGDSSAIERMNKVFSKSYAKLCLTQKDINKLLLLGNFIPAATTFMKKDLWEQSGGYDENIPLMEDWPFWIKVGHMNKRFYFNPIETVKYRMHEKSLSGSEKPSQRYMESMTKAKEYADSVLLQHHKFLWLYTKGRGFKTTKPFLKAIVKLLVLLVNPMSYYLLYLRLKVMYSN